MKAIAILIGVLVSCSAASEELTNRTQEPSVEILGVKIVRGMPESEVRASLPDLYCAARHGKCRTGCGNHEALYKSATVQHARTLTGIGISVSVRPSAVQ